MKNWLYLIFFLAMFLVFPLFYAKVLTPYRNIAFYPTILILVTLTPSFARFLSTWLGNKAAGSRGGKILKTAVYWIIAFEVMFIIIYVFLGALPQ